MTGHDFYSFLRQHISIILIGGAAGTVALTPASYVWLVILFWAVIVIWLSIGAHTRTRLASRRFPGVMRRFVFAPTPMGSVFESLAEQGVGHASVKSVDLMSCDLGESLRYFLKGEKDGSPSLAQRLSLCPDMEVTVYGRKTSELPTIERVHVVPTRDRYVEHINVISTKDGRNFIWYEPYHNVVDGHHYFKRGAYLFEVSEDVANKERARLRALPVAA